MMPNPASPSVTAREPKRISSLMTYFYKRVFPTFWFGFLALFIFLSATVPPAEPNARASRPPAIFFALIPCAMAVFGFFLMKALLWDLVDDVTDVGDALIVRKGTVKERIPFSNIINVNASQYINPPRITLRLREPGALGRDVAFMIARTGAFLRQENPLVNDLIERVDIARRELTKPETRI